MIPLWLFYLLGFGIASCSFIAGFILCAMFRVGSAGEESGQPSKTTDDYIDWSKIPAGYDWVAVDNDGVVCQYHKKEPIIDEDIGIWCVQKSGGFWYPTDKLDKSVIIGPLPPWRESLRMRPK